MSELPRTDDLPRAQNGLDPERVEEAFAHFGRRVRELEEVAADLRAELRALRAERPAAPPPPARYEPEEWPLEAGDVPTDWLATIPPPVARLFPVPRLALEALFLLGVGLLAGLADLDTVWIVGVMAGAWALVALSEWAAAARRARWRLDEIPPPMAAAGAGDESTGPWSIPVVEATVVEAADSSESHTVVASLPTPVAAAEPAPTDEAPGAVDDADEPSVAAVADEAPVADPVETHEAAAEPAPEADEAAAGGVPDAVEEEAPPRRRRFWRRHRDELAEADGAAGDDDMPADSAADAHAPGDAAAGADAAEQPEDADAPQLAVQPEEGPALPAQEDDLALPEQPEEGPALPEQADDVTPLPEQAEAMDEAPALPETGEPDDAPPLPEQADDDVPADAVREPDDLPAEPAPGRRRGFWRRRRDDGTVDSWEQ